MAKAKKTKLQVKIELPAVLRVYDYHEFDQAESFYKEIGLKLKIDQIGVGYGGSYLGIVYKTKDENFKLLKKQLDEECDDR